MMRDRDEHLAWCKQRAREYCDRGDLADAVTSMLSDLNKHPEFKGIADKMGPIGLLYSMSGDVVSVRRFIEGFR